MASFDQRGQTVQYQYNANVINFGAAQIPEDYLQQLKNFQSELTKAIDEKAIEGEAAIDVDSHLKKAILQAEQPAPNKKTLSEHLSQVKDLVGVDLFTHYAACSAS